MSSSLMGGDSSSLGVIHPKSRKAEQLNRAIHVEARKVQRGKLKYKGKVAQGQFFSFLRNQICLPEHVAKKSFSYDEITSLLEQWAHRFDDELADLEQASKRITREHEMKMLVTEEMQKLRTGYSCPDLRMKKVVTLLREWDENYDGLARFKTDSFKLKLNQNSNNASKMDLNE